MSVRGTAVRVSNITPLSTPFLCNLSVSDVCCQVGCECEGDGCEGE